MHSNSTHPCSLKNTTQAFVAVCCLVFVSVSTASGLAEEITLHIEDNELSLLRFNAEGEHLVIWISPGFGNFQRAHDTAFALSERGIEVWYIDLAESLFMPQSTQTLRGLDGRYVAGLIRQAHGTTGKYITLMSRSYGALPLLRGARQWQLQAAGDDPGRSGYLTGAILFSPELYSEIPPLGMEPVFDPIASSSNIPMMLFQASQRGNRWQLDKTLALLEKGGAAIYLKILQGVTGVFFLKDSAAETMAVLDDLPAEIERAVVMLKRIPTPEYPSALAHDNRQGHQGLDLTLRPFSSSMEPVAIELSNINGDSFTRTSFTGKVTLVNFWASWCGPCVEEIPALNRLREQMQGKPFELVSINYAEQPEQIREFMDMIKVDFPVLLDQDGSFSAKWNVLVYPATFVIAMDGSIAYGVNGAIEWDSDEVVSRLLALMKH